MLKVVVFAYPNCLLYLYSLPMIIFKEKVKGKSLFEVATASEDGQEVVTLDGIKINPTGDLKLFDKANLILIPGWHDLEQRPSPELIEALQKAYKKGAIIVGLCYAAYVLAYAGLLDGKKAVTHWQVEKDFKERFKNVSLNINALYIEDERVVTSAGVAAGADCCLYLVRRFFGIRASNEIARALVLQPFREGGQAQYREEAPKVSSKDKLMDLVVKEIEEKPERDYSLDSLASKVCMSKRTFTRHFKQAVGMSVTSFVIAQRLRLACNLLESSNLSIDEIALKCGFKETVQLRRNFYKRFAVSPKLWRKTFKEKS